MQLPILSVVNSNFVVYGLWPRGVSVLTGEKNC